MMKRRHPLLALAILALYGAAPASAGRQDVRVDKNLSYGAAGGQSLLLDVYSPASVASPRPAVMLVHGGGWMAGDKSFYAGLGHDLAALGFVCFSVNYRLVAKDTNRYPAAVDDVQRAVRWVRANAATYHVDPRRIGALGDSAGGHLVSLLGTRDTRDNSDHALARFSSRVSCVVDLYGPSDLEHDPVTPLAASVVLAFIGKPIGEAPSLYREASPITYVSHRSASFLIFHGTKDPLVPLAQSQRLCDALKKAGVEATLVVMQNDGHGFAIPANQATFLADTKAFFQRHLRP